MITDGLVHFVCALFRGLIDTIPPWSPQLGDWHSAAQSTGQVVGMLDKYLPVSVLIGCLVAVFGFKVALTAWRLLVFVYDRFPLKFT